jgi:hypothetical protein
MKTRASILPLTCHTRLNKKQQLKKERMNVIAREKNYKNAELSVANWSGQ